MKNFIIGALIIVILGLGGYLMFKSQKNDSDETKNNTTETAASTSSELIDGDLTMAGAKATIYYGKGCPHCSKLESWLQSNKYLPSGSKISQSDVDSWIANAKVKFNIKEVWYNQTNSAELTEKATACGLTSQQTGVPLLFDSENNKCLIGETDAQNYFTSNSK